MTGRPDRRRRRPAPRIALAEPWWTKSALDVVLTLARRLAVLSLVTAVALAWLVVTWVADHHPIWLFGVPVGVTVGLFARLLVVEKTELLAAELSGTLYSRSLLGLLVVALLLPLIVFGLVGGNVAGTVASTGALVALGAPNLIAVVLHWRSQRRRDHESP